MVNSMINGSRLICAFTLVAFIAASPAVAQSLDDLKLPPAPAQPWRFERFPIIAWWGPPGTATPDDFRRYKDAGFTLYAANPDAGYDRAVPMARDAGLKVMAFRTVQGFGLPGAAVDYAKHDDAIVGWLTHDEPSGVAAVSASITAVNDLMRQDPTRRALFNMLPPGAQHNPNTQQVIAAAVRNGLPILSFDHYFIHADGRDDEGAQLANLELFRRASLEHDLPFWAFALTIKHFHYRRPSESDVRWVQYMNLAYGAKGLWYFTYWGPTSWENWDTVAIVDPKDGAPTDLYDHVKALNGAVLAMGDVLLRLRNVDVFHAPTAPAGHRALPGDGGWWIRDCASSDPDGTVVSFFEDRTDGTPYALVVNKRHGAGKSAADTTSTIKLMFAPDVTAVEAINWLDGQPGPISITDHRATLDVAGGTGVLLRATRRLDAPVRR